MITSYRTLDIRYENNLLSLNMSYLRRHDAIFLLQSRCACADMAGSQPTNASSSTSFKMKTMLLGTVA